MDLNQLIPLVTAAIGPVIGIFIGIARLWRGDHQLEDLLKLSELHRQLPAEEHSASLELIHERFHEYAQRRRRKVNRLNLGTLIAVVVVGGGMTYGLVFVALQAGGAWQWIVGFIAALVGLFTLGLSITGVSQLYDPPKTQTSDASK